MVAAAVAGRQAAPAIAAAAPRRIFYHKPRQVGKSAELAARVLDWQRNRSVLRPVIFTEVGYWNAPAKILHGLPDDYMAIDDTGRRLFPGDRYCSLCLRPIPY